ncbi:aspartate aminotransferase family protein [Pseudoalteromonas denitrificans]|uniref:Glutamate-1-semialdehyde 2,1-aminomutase n=1 Tax=Pseudoalteromonas denitrificans DSM 6059 TaxID=1123010 RepID=A0A1I1H032_9GAMM|nr:aspartate aminotransferase family protein [Pseudoalteromonas denitrificans]SFC17141.1 glutamate-1-semialdehyde 2,1-aminomutase [Pseudoalteromonas denitrificans DSM 6059]
MIDHLAEPIIEISNKPQNSQINKSAALFERAKKVLPGGISRNTIFKLPHPDYVEKGEGCIVTDINGKQYIDFANNMASLIHGHAHPIVTKAIVEQVQKGTAFTMASEVEVQYAELLCSRVPGFEKIRFVNSGTEAVMAMIKSARAFTGKAKIAKVEGAYHGAYDYAEVSQTANPNNWGQEDKPNSVPVAYGTPEKALDDVIIIPYNDIPKALEILDKHTGDIAAILLDPVSHRVGMVPANDDFVEALYEWTRKQKALLLFDEVITFRVGFSGAQQRYKVSPDLTAMGKMIGGGFPVGAFAGRSDVMSVLDPTQPKVLLPHSGTFSANPVTMVAGLTAMKLFDHNAVEKINALGDFAREKIRLSIKKVGIKACVTGAGSMLRVHLKAKVPTNYRDAFMSAQENAALKILLAHSTENGIMLINTCSAMLSTVMTEKEILILCNVLESGFIKVLKQIPSLKS